MCSEGVAADQTAEHPRVIDGARRAPQEDLGGLPGFEEFLGAMTHSKHHDHDNVMTGYGRPCGGTVSVTEHLAKLAMRLGEDKAAFEKRRNRIN